ncbi:helix-turn-helix transcriptional regulator [bacterium]|nr:helix-turn-helix transcriptional regulator [bacterium]
MHELTKREEFVLLAIWKLGENAYGITVRKAVIEMSKQRLHYGSLYNTLYQLVKKGLVDTAESAPESVKGGRSKVLYRLTPAGRRALKSAQEIHRSVWGSIPSFAFGEE